MDIDETKNVRSGYLLAFLCAFVASLMIVLIKWVQAYLPAFSILFLSQVVAGGVLSLLVLSRGTFRKLGALSARGWTWLAVIVAITFFAYWTLFVALELLDPTVASFVGRAETLVTIFLGMILFGERMGGREILGALLVLSGVLIIRFTAGIEMSHGLMLCLLSALFWGVAEALAKKAVQYLEPFLFTWARSLLLIPAFWIAAACSKEGLVMPQTPEIWTGVIGLSIAGPVLGRYLYLKSLTLIPVSKCALINQSQPVWVAALACLLLGTLPGLREWIGGLFIMGGCIILVW
ncbi:MAG: DMT family transporter, partial [Planctomycetota bacterium]